MKAVRRAAACLAVMLGWLLLGSPAPVATALAGEPAVAGVRLGLHPHLTRVVVDLTGAPDYRVFALDDPPRIVIDLSGAALDLSPDDLPGQRGLVAAVRAGRPAPGVSRITIDLAATAAVADVELLKGSQRRPYRLVVDLTAEEPDADAVVARADAAEPDPAAEARDDDAPQAVSDVPPSVPGGPGTQLAALPAPPPQPATADPEGADPGDEAALPAALPLPPIKPRAALAALADKPLVVIDPGHGGIDPGAISPSGLEEKTITLAVAKAVRDQLLATGDYRVMLTRGDDTFIRLRDRFEIARSAGAALFVSLHADSHDDPQTRGASVYTLSETASDKEAAALADRENRADLLADVALSEEQKKALERLTEEQKKVVVRVLDDFRRLETARYSNDFAETVVQRLAAATRLLRNTHRWAGFAVLKAPDVPSVLIELGYLSNKSDERQLASRRHQARLAAAIVRSIRDYFRKHPQEVRLNASGAGNRFPG
ncbi:MAG: N-acetylmuramoyl-L-alanine amidase [Rhodospirillaceae bacterium]|nr:N-acetylmuramoyl-L-alanine amidase [Rhodospirillaceae bacterium]